jgi:ribonuclease E
MPTEDSFDPADPLPRFLDEQEEQDFGNYRDEGAVLSRLFKVSLLIAAVAVTGLAVVAFGNPVALFTDATASLVGNSSPKPVTDQPAPAIQSAENAQSAENGPASGQPTADVQVFAQASPPAATDAPAREENTAAGPASRDQAAPSDAASEALFRRFQTWLSEQDAQTQATAEPAQPVLAAPAPIMQEYPAPVAESVGPPHRPLQKRRQDPAVHNAQADPRAPNVRKPAPRAQAARAAPPPTRIPQDARAQEPPAPQPAQAPPSFSSIFGQRN